MDGTSTIAGERLKSYVERIERLNEEKAALAEDIKEVFAEVKSAGFDVKTVREIIKERKKDAATRDEQITMFDLYWDAIDGAQG